MVGKELENYKIEKLLKGLEDNLGCSCHGKSMEVWSFEPKIVIIANDFELVYSGEIEDILDNELIIRQLAVLFDKPENEIQSIFEQLKEPVKEKVNNELDNDVTPSIKIGVSDLKGLSSFFGSVVKNIVQIANEFKNVEIESLDFHMSDYGCEFIVTKGRVGMVAVKEGGSISLKELIGSRTEVMDAINEYISSIGGVM